MAIFEYSPEEWAEIRKQARNDSVDKYPVGLKLILAANAYLMERARKEAPDFKTRHQKAKAWEKVEKSAQKLGRAIDEIDDVDFPYLDLSLSPPEADRVGLSLERDEELRGLQENALIRICIDRVAGNARRLSLREHDLAEYRKHRDADAYRLDFYKDVLRIWTGDLGRELRISRTPNRNTVTGPLVRFFLAVATPVMKDETPRPESIADIVARERKERPKREARYKRLSSKPLRL